MALSENARKLHNLVASADNLHNPSGQRSKSTAFQGSSLFSTSKSMGRSRSPISSAENLAKPPMFSADSLFKPSRYSEFLAEDSDKMPEKKGILKMPVGSAPQLDVQYRRKGMYHSYISSFIQETSTVDAWTEYQPCRSL